MSRPLRIEFADATYHVTARGNEQRDIFYCDEDRIVFLGFLAQAVHRFGWSLTAWVLMTNHYHLVLQTPQPNLSRGMQWLNGRYAQWFNRRHGRVGHLFQGRFKGLLVEKERYLAEVTRYVVLNPVRAGLVERPEDYCWSSYRATAGLEEAPAWLDVDGALQLWPDERSVSQIYYRQYVLERIGIEDSLWQDLINGIYLGGESWTKAMRAQVESKIRSSDHPRAQRAVGRPHMSAIIGAVAKVTGETTDRIRTTRPFRALVAWIGWNEGLITLREIAASLRLRSEGHISNMIRSVELQFERDESLRSHLELSMSALAA